MNITNGVNLFGYKPITWAQFEPYSSNRNNKRFVHLEDRTAELPDPLAMIITEANIDDFLVQAYLQFRHRHFSSDINVRRSERYRKSDASELFHDEDPSKVEFDGYIAMLNLMLYEELRDSYTASEGFDTYESMAINRVKEDVAMSKEQGWSYAARDRCKFDQWNDGLCYFKISPKTESSKVFFLDSTRPKKENTKILELIASGDDFFSGRESISFVAPFGINRKRIPLVNVVEFYYLNEQELIPNADRTANTDALFSGKKYSKAGIEPVKVSYKDTFSL